jgi:hypothetical protein
MHSKQPVLLCNIRSQTCHIICELTNIQVQEKPFHETIWLLVIRMHFYTRWCRCRYMRISTVVLLNPITDTLTLITNLAHDEVR